MKHTLIAAALSILPLSASAFDTCLVGTWVADADQMGREMAAIMGGSMTHQSGQAVMTIDQHQSISMNVNDLVFRVQTPGVAPFDMKVYGYSEGSMHTESNGQFRTNITAYSLRARAEIMGTVMQMPVTGYGDNWGRALGSYSCAGSRLTFDTIQEGSMPRIWRRGG